MCHEVYKQHKWSPFQRCDTQDPEAQLSFLTSATLSICQRHHLQMFMSQRATGPERNNKHHRWPLVFLKSFPLHWALVPVLKDTPFHEWRHSHFTSSASSCQGFWPINTFIYQYSSKLKRLLSHHREKQDLLHGFAGTVHVPVLQPGSYKHLENYASKDYG